MLLSKNAVSQLAHGAEHVEHIFQRLGVETRTAAAARAWEAAAATVA